jgi:hypothetical protein
MIFIAFSANFFQAIFEKKDRSYALKFNTNTTTGVGKFINTV